MDSRRLNGALFQEVTGGGRSNVHLSAGTASNFAGIPLQDGDGSPADSTKAQ